MISKKQKARFKRFKEWVDQYQHNAGNWLAEMERTEGAARLYTAQHVQLWLDDVEAWARQFAQAVSDMETSLIMEGITVTRSANKFGSKESRQAYNRNLRFRDEASTIKHDLETLVDKLLTA
jgi:hypothetical protein